MFILLNNSIHAVSNVSYLMELFDKLGRHNITRLSLSNANGFFPDGKLPPGVFKGMKNLKELYVVNSKLTEVDLFTFRGLTSLEHLDLSKNFFDSLPTGVFGGLEQLHTLNIKNTRVVVLPHKIFLPLRNLKQLDLSLNRLVSVPWLGYLCRCEMIDLSSNYITDLGTGCVLPSTLTHFNIANNRLSHIQDDVFKCCCKLVYVNVDANEFETQPQGHTLQVLETFGGWSVSNKRRRVVRDDDESGEEHSSSKNNNDEKEEEKEIVGARSGGRRYNLRSAPKKKMRM